MILLSWPSLNTDRAKASTFNHTPTSAWDTYVHTYIEHVSFVHLFETRRRVAVSPVRQAAARGEKRGLVTKVRKQPLHAPSSVGRVLHDKRQGRHPLGHPARAVYPHEPKLAKRAERSGGKGVVRALKRRLASPPYGRLMSENTEREDLSRTVGPTGVRKKKTRLPLGG